MCRVKVLEWLFSSLGGREEFFLIFSLYNCFTHNIVIILWDFFFFIQTNCVVKMSLPFKEADQVSKIDVIVIAFICKMENVEKVMRGDERKDGKKKKFRNTHRTKQ